MRGREPPLPLFNVNALLTTLHSTSFQALSYLPVKVLRSSQGDQAVGRGQLAEHADVVAVLELAACRLFFELRRFEWMFRLFK